MLKILFFYDSWGKRLNGQCTSIKILYKYDSVLESYMLIDNVQAKGTEVKISITSPMDGTYINLSNQSAFRVSGTCSGGGGG